MKGKRYTMTLNGGSAILHVGRVPDEELGERALRQLGRHVQPRVGEQVGRRWPAQPRARASRRASALRCRQVSVNMCISCDGRGVIVCDNCQGTGIQPRFLERYSPDDFMD